MVSQIFVSLSLPGGPTTVDIKVKPRVTDNSHNERSDVHSGLDIQEVHNFDIHSIQFEIKHLEEPNQIGHNAGTKRFAPCSCGTLICGFGPRRKKAAGEEYFGSEGLNLMDLVELRGSEQIVDWQKEAVNEGESTKER